MLKRYFLGPLAALLLTTSFAAQAQTGSVGIGTTTPNAAAALEIQSTSQGLLLPRLTLTQRDALTANTSAPPVPGLVIYQTDNTPGLYAYDGTTWVRLGADNLGNHTATQTLNLNSQRLLGNVGTSLGDSTAQVELSASVGTQSAALLTRSNFGARYSRAILSGYGKLPDGTSTANDFGIWATGYRGGSWAGFFSAGSTTTPLRWVGICQNPGYNNTGSAIRIVDGTQGAGKVLTSDGIGYGKWQPVPAPTAAGGDFNLGPYYLVGNGGSTGIAISSGGSVGIGTNAPGAGLHVVTGNNGVGSGTGAFLSGPPTGNPNLELRGGSTAVTPYVDLAETSSVDYSSRLLSSGGTLNVYAANATALKVNGNAVVTGSLTVNGVNVTSDQRFKTNVRPLAGALASVLALRGVRYEWNALGVQHGGTAGASQVGLLAQEVERIYPELVSTDAQGYKAVNYAQLTPVLLEALKEQQTQIETLKFRAATAEAAAAQATSAADSAQGQAAQATAALETFEARLRRLEAGTAQAQR